MCHGPEVHLSSCRHHHLASQRAGYENRGAIVGRDTTSRASGVLDPSAAFEMASSP